MLDGIRVVEFEGIGPGPFAAMMLADMGAEVIVVERPTSANPTVGQDNLLNRGKKSIQLDGSVTGRKRSASKKRWGMLVQFINLTEGDRKKLRQVTSFVQEKTQENGLFRISVLTKQYSQRFNITSNPSKTRGDQCPWQRVPIQGDLISPAALLFVEL